MKKGKGIRIAVIIVMALAILALGALLAVYIRSSLSGTGITAAKAGLTHSEAAAIVEKYGQSEKEESADDDGYASITQVGNVAIKGSGAAAAANSIAEQDYIFPDSSTTLLTDAEVSAASKANLRLARNEILARHGRIFDTVDLQQYFESKSWYSGTVDGKTFDASMDSILNQVELKNIELIKKYEK